MESQPQNPEFRNNPENSYPCFTENRFQTSKSKAPNKKYCQILYAETTRKIQRFLLFI